MIFHLVLTDTKMPCMTGPELAEDVAEEIDQRKIKVPVIGMSNRAGCCKFYQHFWNKNHDPQKLFRLIEKLIVKSP